MNAEQFERAIKFAVKRIVETLESWNAPWLPRDDNSPEQAEAALFQQAFGFQPNARGARLMQAWAPGTDIDPQYEDGEVAELGRVARSTLIDCGGSTLAKNVLATLGIDADERSQLFGDLSVEMGRLHVALRRTLASRAEGDHSAEARFTNYYRRYLPTDEESAAATTPTISEAWRTYSAEKLSGPKPAWGAHTAKKQQAAFEEWRDIVGNIHVGEVTRETMLRVRSVLGKLPANAHKRYPSKSIAELLAMDIPTDQLPADRTVLEKLVQIGSFLRWCREIQRYLTADPMIGVHFEAESQSYAPFNLDDLKQMFNGRKYEQHKHRKSWHYWQPLLALYTGARQTELAQLTVRDVVQEDGVWILAITDAGEDQRVKTKAAIRKVPISSKLIELGFLEYVAFLRERGETRLFPDLNKGTHGWGEKVSRWFADTFSKGAGIQSDPSGRRKVWHSFRHTAITKALQSRQQLAHVQQIFGHEQSLLGETATYMGEFDVAALVPVIEALDWGLDHSGYKDDWRKYVEQWPAQSADSSTDAPTISDRTSARARRAA